MRSAIINQCFGLTGWFVLQHGVMLVYLKSLGIPDSRLLLYLALPLLISTVLKLPAAYLADGLGKKRVGTIGAILQALGFVVVTVAGSLSPVAVEPANAFALVIYGIGTAMFYASWYALLSPIVLEAFRGRFFARLRMSWQTAGIIFTAACAYFLPDTPTPGLYQAIMAVTAISLVIRIPFYAAIPELEPPIRQHRNFWATFINTLRAESLVPVTIYVFFVHLFTSAGPYLFGLIQKDVLNYGDNDVVFMQVIMMIGMVIGYYLGGRFIDRWSAKPVFISSHIMLVLSMLLFFFRNFVPLPVTATIVIAQVLFGIAQAAFLNAWSTELMLLIPQQNKSLSSAIFLLAADGGVGLSGALAGGLIGLQMIRTQWHINSVVLSHYDAILLLYAAMTVLLTVMLCLVPSVIGKAQWLPQGR